MDREPKIQPCIQAVHKIYKQFQEANKFSEGGECKCWRDKEEVLGGPKSSRGIGKNTETKKSVRKNTSNKKKELGKSIPRKTNIIKESLF